MRREWFERVMKMAHIAWQEQYNLGISIIDEHHHHLVDLLNILDDNSDASPNQHREVVGVVLIKLLNYTKYHFSEEEKMMKEMQYEGFDLHREEHANFEKKVDYFIEQYRLGNSTLSVETLHFLNQWLLEHILITDRKFADDAKKVLKV